MEKQPVSVTIYLTVHDEEEFRSEARDRALRDGLSIEEADAFKCDERTSLGECARMLIDPGLSPAGSQIEDSTAE